MENTLDQTPVQPDPIPDSVGNPAPEPQLPDAKGRKNATGSSILGPLVGGMIAAVAGFALAHFNAFGLQTAPDQTAYIAAQAETAQALATVKSDLAAMKADLPNQPAAAPTVPPDLSPIEAKLTSLENRIAALETLPVGQTGADPALSLAVTELQKRVAALDTGLPGDVSTQVDAALQRLAKVEAAASANVEKAATLIAATQRADAVDKLKLAAASGGPFVAELQVLADPDIPPALTAFATTGMVTIAALQESFPDAARAALLAAHAADPQAGWGQRALDFLKAQSGARPLTPRDGTDAEAVVSRADAAVREARISDALTELAGLDPVAAAPLADWRAQAEQWVAVEAAFTALSAKGN